MAQSTEQAQTRGSIAVRQNMTVSSWWEMCTALRHATGVQESQYPCAEAPNKTQKPALVWEAKRAAGLFPFLVQAGLTMAQHNCAHEILGGTLALRAHCTLLLD